MQRLTFFVVAIALLYSAYWLVGARAVTQATETQITDLREAGWTVGYDILSMNGFPSRFDTSITQLDLQSPDGQIAYQAPFVQALALSYQPNRVILALPSTQSLTLGPQTYDIATNGLRASAALAANTALSLDQITAEAQGVTVTNAVLGTVTFTDFLAAVREGGPLPNSYDVYLNAQDVTLPDSLLAILPADQTLDSALQIVNADATVVLDRPLDRHTLPDWSDAPGKLRGFTLRALDLRWGDLAISGDGAVTVDETGTPDGTLTLRATDWQRMLDIALEAGLVTQDYRFIAQSMGQTLSRDETDLTLSIRFQNGNMSIGPIPLGPAPKVF